MADPKNPAKIINGSDFTSKNVKGSFVRRLAFFDAAEREIFNTADNHANHPASMQVELKPNEELIGVYGVSNDKSTFSSFGFIV